MHLACLVQRLGGLNDGAEFGGRLDIDEGTTCLTALCAEDRGEEDYDPAG